MLLSSSWCFVETRFIEKNLLYPNVRIVYSKEGRDEDL